VLPLVYGVVIGGLNAWWIDFEAPASAAAASAEQTASFSKPT
jgi:hypothetical protein